MARLLEGTGLEVNNVFNIRKEESRPAMDNTKKPRSPAKAQVKIGDTTYVVEVRFGEDGGVYLREKGKRTSARFTPWTDVLSAGVKTNA